MKRKTLQESAKELKESINRLHKTREQFLKTYFEVYTQTYNKSEDGLPERIINKSDWD